MKRLTPALVALLVLLPAASRPVPARAQAGMWAIDTNTCTPDGTRCIKGIVRDGPPSATLQECEKKLQALLRQYHAANLKVMFMRCVQLR